MNRKIRKRLLAHGHVLVPPAEELCTVKGSFAAKDGKTFFAWFKQNVLGLASEEYRRAFWREAYRTGHTIGHVPRTFKNWHRGRWVHPSARVADMLLICLVVGGASLAFWFIRKAVHQYLSRVRRPSYYISERERRLILADERRQQGHRTTTNPRPSLETIRVLFAQVKHNPEAALRLGGLLEDLECYLDNRPRYAGDRCIGRAGGIKRHLQEHAPDLFEHYSALMRYKAIAKRFRQAVGVEDPVPTDALLPGAADIPTKSALKGRAVAAAKIRIEGTEIATMPVKTNPAERARKITSQTTKNLAENAEPIGMLAARERAAEILAEGMGSVIALEAALALRLDPDCIPAMTDRAAMRTKNTPPRIFDWLRRRRSA